MGHPFKEIKELAATNLLQALRGGPTLLTPFSSMFEDLLPLLTTRWLQRKTRAWMESSELPWPALAIVSTKPVEDRVHALRQIVAAQDEPISVKDAFVLREWLLVLEEHL